MAERWTPGPWRVNKYGSVGAGDLGHEPIVAQVEPFYGADTQYGDHSANARLIAAGPDIYGALTSAAVALGHAGQLMMTGAISLPAGLVEEFADALAAANTALRKARGEQP